MSDIDYDGTIASRYERGRGLSPEAVATWHTAIHGRLPAGAAIVDVGAGTGRFSRLLADLQTGPIIAVEPATGMRDAAHSAAACDISWMAGSAEALPVKNQSVGAIWSAFTTHYLHLELAGQEFRRVLRPNGRVLIWHAFPDVFDDLAWFRWFPTARAIDEERMPSADAVTAAFDRAGLQFASRTEHQMLIASSLGQLADRMAERAISTLTLISDEEFDHGLAAMRAQARKIPAEPIYAPNVLLVFESS